jgi:hypothetical protein
LRVIPAVEDSSAAAAADEKDLRMALRDEVEILRRMARCMVNQYSNGGTFIIKKRILVAIVDYQHNKGGLGSAGRACW